MILNDVLGAGPKRVHRFRVGRGPGSGIGKTAGRGQHGAQSRSGYSNKSGFEGGTMRFFRRLPRRGFNNANFRTEWTGVNVGLLEKAFAAGETVTLAAAIERRVVRRNAERLKVLGDGTLTKALTIDASVAASASARAKIEAAGGKVLAPPSPKIAPNFKRIAIDKERAAKAKAAAEAAAKAKAAAEGAPKGGAGGAGKPAKGEKKPGGGKGAPAEAAPKKDKPPREPRKPGSGEAKKE